MGYGTVAELQKRLTRDGLSPLPDEPTCQGYLDDAQDLIDGFCRRDFLDHPDDTLTLEGKGLESLLMSHPLRSVSAVSVDGLDLTADELAALTVVPYGVIRGYRFPLGSVVKITCSWGYEDVPARILKASMTLASRIARYRAIREKRAQGLRSQSVEGVAVSLDPEQMDGDVARLLALYVKRRAAR